MLEFGGEEDGDGAGMFASKPTNAHPDLGDPFAVGQEELGGRLGSPRGSCISFTAKVSGFLST